MFISIKKDRNLRVICLVESYRDENGKNKNRVVKRFGRVEDYTDEQIKALKDKYGGQKIAKDLEVKNRISTLKDLLAMANDTCAPKPMTFEVTSLKYGHLLLKRLWDDMGLKSKIDYEQKQSGIDKSVPINAVLFYVASTKFCAFESINDAYLAQTDYLYNYVDGFSLDDFVKALNFANSIKDKVIPYLNKSLSEAPALQDLLNNTHDDLCSILFKVMLSIIKLRLKKRKFNIREDQISKILFEAQLTYIKLSDVETLYLRPTMVSTLTHQKGLDFGIKDNDFVSIKSPLDAISEVLGVLPIPTIASLANIKESLKIRQKDALAISSSIVKLQKNAV